ARLSRRLPARIVCCSESARRIHARLGYAAEKMLVIPNGFDLTVYRPAPFARAELRQELGLPADAVVIGLVARFDPLKDHCTFVRAAALLAPQLPEVRFVLCGDGVSWQNAELTRWIEEAGLARCFRLLGRRDDVARLHSALD